MINVRPGDLHAFAARCLSAVGVSDGDAATVADVLLAADLRGIDSHGCARLRRYVDGVRAGRIDAGARPTVVADAPAAAVIDAGNGLGQPAAVAAIDLAIAKASATGVGAVTVRRSNHFGIAGFYAERASRRGFGAFVTTNASPQVAPTHGVEAMFGTNPVAFSFPTDDERPFVFDAATSVVPRGRLERLSREGRARPEPGWVVGGDGDLAELVSRLKARDGVALLPLGGAGETSGGHKGYGLALVAELLCGPLAGASWGRHVYGPGAADLGQFFLCLDIDRFRPRDEFALEARRMFDELRASRPADRNRPVLIPGDREHDAAAQRRHAIPLRPAVWDDLSRIADDCGVALPAPLDRAVAGG